MKVIIAGSRSITSLTTIYNAIEQSGFAITEVVSGGARGVDKVGELWAKSHNIPCKVFQAEWNKHGRAAGARRNVDMALYADALIAIWDGVSPGTRNMIRTIEKLGKPICVARGK